MLNSVIIGFGFVTFQSEDVVDKVCEIHFHEINNKMPTHQVFCRHHGWLREFRVECKKAQPKEVMLPANLAKTRAAGRTAYGELVVLSGGPTATSIGAVAAAAVSYKRLLAATAAASLRTHHHHPTQQHHPRPPTATLTYPLSELLGVQGLDVSALYGLPTATLGL
ncbi:RNA-binding protein Musashi like Rbp6 [Pseudolycoriella hygida]|uniref:RNA-binding protein Musashi like Rbp6 n=1 Tax=Pseudolycoriella hygida TaxID=35572 RepID=A0A9Q0N8N9_9DIPT|nr:RNA-binding protein Musashi like Rbp6 [Pseudolycoriella hygida]